MAQTGQTVAGYGDVMKDIWTQDQLEKQFYDDNLPLDRLERTNKHTIGNEARVPLHKGRAGAHTVTDSAGSTALNGPNPQKVDRAVYTLSYNYHYIGLQTGVLNQANGGAHSVGDGMETEVSGGVADMRKQVMRQFARNGDGLIAECAVTGASTTVNLAPAGYGYDAIVRGHLVPGQLIDIGTASNPVSVAEDREIVSVKEDPADPEIVISGAAVTTAAGDFVSLANSRVTTTTKEATGLEQIAGSNTLPVGGLDPDTAGEEFWKPAEVVTASTGGPGNAGATSLSLDLLLHLRQKINQKTGKKNTVTWTSLRQQANLESILQNQVRFTNPKKLESGDASLEWNGMEFHGDPDIYDRDLFMLTIEDYLIVTGAYSKPTWMTDIEGSGGRLVWQPGTTQFVDAVCYALNLAIRRRNGSAACTALTA